MASIDHEIARQMFAGWNSGNVDRMTEFWAEDGDWIWEDPPDMPDARVLRGREEVEAHLRDLIETLGEMSMTIEEMADVDDELMVVTRFTTRGAQSGIQMDVPIFHLVDFEDGRVRRYRTFTDREQALRAAESG
jgi:ketosteroid isomerase-like protein